MSEYHPTLDPDVQQLIRRKARALSRTPCFRQDEVDDITQAIAYKLIQAWPRYNPRRGSPGAFIYTVVTNALCSLLRFRSSAARRTEECAGLSGDVLAEADLTEVEQADLRLDVAEALADLPSDLRALAEGLMRDNLSDAARACGISRSTAQGWKERLRQRFEDRGLRALLEDAPSIEEPQG